MRTAPYVSVVVVKLRTKMRASHPATDRDVNGTLHYTLMNIGSPHNEVEKPKQAMPISEALYSYLVTPFIFYRLTTSTTPLYYIRTLFICRISYIQEFKGLVHL